MEVKILWLALVAKAQGRKTYLVAGVACVAAILLVVFGKVTPVAAIGGLIFFVGLISAALRAALQRHHDEELKLLNDVLAVGVSLRDHDPDSAMKIAAMAVQDGVTLATEFGKETAE